MPACSAPTWLTRGSSSADGRVSGASSSAPVASAASTACCVDLASCSSRSASESWADTSHCQWAQRSGFGRPRSPLRLAARPFGADLMGSINAEHAGHWLKRAPLAPCAQGLLAARHSVEGRRAHRGSGPFDGGAAARASWRPLHGKHASGGWGGGREREGLHGSDCVDTFVCESAHQDRIKHDCKSLVRPYR